MQAGVEVALRMRSILVDSERSIQRDAAYDWRSAVESQGDLE